MSKTKIILGVVVIGLVVAALAMSDTSLFKGTFRTPVTTRTEPNRACVPVPGNESDTYPKRCSPEQLDSYSSEPGITTLYHVSKREDRCSWGCSAGTKSDDTTGECKCDSAKGLFENGVDSCGRRVCTCSDGLMPARNARCPSLTCPDGSSIPANGVCLCEDGSPMTPGTPPSCPPLPQEEVVSCTETDGGNNINVAGKTARVVDGVETEAQNDSCAPAPEKRKVIEYFCNNSLVESSTQDCSKGYLCREGACVEQPPPSCKDDVDGGDNINVAGRTVSIDLHGNEHMAEDVCEDGDRAVRENYCWGVFAKSRISTCGAGFVCREGACVDNTPPSVSFRSPQAGLGDVVTAGESVDLVVDVEDNIEVARVEFFDGDTPIGSIDPYRLDSSFVWDTAGVSGDAEHRIKAKAYDTSGNIGEAIVSIFLTPPPPPPPPCSSPAILQPDGTCVVEGGVVEVSNEGEEEPDEHEDEDEPGEGEEEPAWYR